MIHFPRLLAIFGLLLLAAAGLSGQNPIPPKKEFLVQDLAHIMTDQQAIQLGEKLKRVALETSTQIVVLTEASLNGEDAFDRSIRIAQEWGIGGTAAKDNGVLIYVARDDRAIRIQTGYGAEGFLPDAIAKRIIDQQITPAFKQGNYYEGLDRATDAIVQFGKGEYTNDGGGNGSGGFPAPVAIFLFIFIAYMIYSAYRRRNNDDDDDDGGYWRGGKYDMDDGHPRRRRRRGGGLGGMIFFPGGFGGGGGGGGGGGFGRGGGFGGGGFGGFGGGGFGGGGAGGSW